MIHLRDKIDLKAKLNELYDIVSQNQFKLTAGKYVSKIGYISDVNLINGLISEFSAYDGNDTIREFLNYLKTSLEENKYSILVDGYIKKLQSSAKADSNVDIISKLSNQGKTI